MLTYRTLAVGNNQVITKVGIRVHGGGGLETFEVVGAADTLIARWSAHEGKDHSDCLCDHVSGLCYARVGDGFVVTAIEFDEVAMTSYVLSTEKHV